MTKFYSSCKLLYTKCQYMKSFFKRNWKLLLNVLTIFLLALAVFFLRDDISGAFRDLGRVNAIFLLLVPAWQAVNYSAYTNLYKTSLELLGAKVRKKSMLKVAFEMDFINTVFPSGGVSGFSYFALRLKGLGVTTMQATMAQTLRFVLTFLSYIILLFVGLFMLAMGGGASNMTILLTCSLAFLTVFGVLVGIYIIGSRKRIKSFSKFISRCINKVVAIVRPKHKEVIKLDKVDLIFEDMHQQYLLLKKNKDGLKSPFLYGLLANVSELATLYAVYMAYGQAVNPGAVIIAYAIANFAGLVAVLPGGVGVYEGLMTGVLVSSGVPAGLAISVTVMYRVLTTIISVVPGYYFYHQNLRTGKLKKDEVEAIIPKPGEKTKHNLPLDRIATEGSDDTDVTSRKKSSKTEVKSR